MVGFDVEVVVGDELLLGWGEWNGLVYGIKYDEVVVGIMYFGKFDFYYIIISMLCLIYRV